MTATMDASSMESLMKAVKLRKKEGAGLLLLRKPILRAAATTSPRSSLRLGRCTVFPVAVRRKKGQRAGAMTRRVLKIILGHPHGLATLGQSTKPSYKT